MARPSRRRNGPSFWEAVGEEISSQVDWGELLVGAGKLALDEIRRRRAAGLGGPFPPGWTAPPPSSDQPPPFDPYQALGVVRGLSLDDYEALFRSRIKRAHPDKGGSDDEATRLTKAIKMIREELRQRPK